MFLDNHCKYSPLLDIVRCSLELSFYQQTSSYAMTRDLGAIIDSDYEKLRKSLVFNFWTLGTGPKKFNLQVPSSLVFEVPIL